MTHFSYPTNRDGRSYGENNDHHEETITIVPVQSVSDKEGERSALTSKASTLVGELNNLRSNIDMMADELQSLLATERAAVEQAELLNVMTSRIRESLNFDHILNVAVKDARNALDADRVLVFAFDPSDWSGKVVAEAVERRWSSALGMELHDPCFAERYASLYEKGRIHAVDNIDEADLGACYVDQLRGLDVKSNLVAPLILGDRLYGLLVAHQCAVSRQWSDSVIEFFRQLAIQVGYALDQASLLNQQRAAAEQAKWLNQINLRVRESLKAEDIFNAAVQETYTALNADRVIFYQLNSEGQGQVIAEEVRRQFPATIGSDLADPFFDAHHREAHLRGQVSAIEDIYDAGLDDATLNQLKLKSIRASLIAPVIAQQNLVGFLVAHQCAVARQWTSLESELLSKVAVQVGYALDQAYALEQQENAALQAQILNEIASRLGTSQDVTEILENAVEDAREVFRADRVLVFQVDQQLKGKAITESADPRWQSLVGKSLQDCGLDERYVKQAQRGRLTILNHPSDAGLSDFQLDRLTDAQVRSLMIAPVVIEKDLFGILVIHSCRQQRLWQEVDSNLLKQISNQISFALERVSLIEQRRMTAERYQRLNDISGRLQESLDISEILNVTVDETRDLLNADRVIVYKFDPEWRGLINAESVVSGYSSILGLETNEPRVTEKFAKAYLRGKITSYENIYEAQFQDCHIKEFASHEVKGYMAIAITTNQKLYGLLIVHQCSAPRQWTEVETNLLKQIAQQTGYSLEQALLREERQRAERLNKVRIRLQETSEVGSLLNVAVEEVRDILGVDRAIVYQFDSSWKGLITAESQAQGYPSTLGLRTNEPRVTEKFAKEYLKGKVTAYSDIYNADFVDCHIGEFAPYEVKSYMAVGIIANQQLYGMLIVHQCSNIRSWNELELDNLKLVAEQVGYALDQALLRQAQEEAIDRTRQVNLISFRIRESLDIERIFRTGVEEALKLMQCDRVVVYRFDDNWDGRIKFEAVKSGWRRLSEDMMTSGDAPCFPEDYVEPYRQGRVQVTPDVSQAGLTACHEEQLGKWQVKANVVVPILVNQKLYGLLGAHQCSTTREWQAPLVESFRQVAIQLGYALDQALLLEEIEAARQKAEMASEEQRQQREILQEQIENFYKEVETSFGEEFEFSTDFAEGEVGTVAEFFDATIANLQSLIKQVRESSLRAEQASEEQRRQREVLQSQIETFLEEIEDSFEGDLTARAGVTDGAMGTVADFFNATIENLEQLVRQVKDSSTIVSETAQSSESGVKNLSQEALRQREVIYAALAKIQGMTQANQEMANKAQNAQSQVKLANQTLQAGDVAMNRTVQGILAIQQTVEATARKVKNLGEASQKISRVLNLIRELANQTNLLALNASVEATRAGEEEQGFAVANEIRTLAEQSANATREIEEIVEEIQAETNEVMKAMEIGRKRVFIGTKLVRGTRSTLTDLAKVSTTINQVVEEIANSAMIQSQTSNELSATMQDVAQISNRTSEDAVTVADSFSKLVDVASELQEGVAQFKTN